MPARAPEPSARPPAPPTFRRRRAALSAFATALLGSAYLALAGCGTVLSTFVPAPTTPRGGLRGSLGVGANVPVGAILALTRSGQDVGARAQNGEMVSQQDVPAITDGIVGLALAPPS